jgi:hypothetical protein
MVLFLSKMVVNQVLANQSPANTLDLNPGHRQKVDQAKWWNAQAYPAITPATKIQNQTDTVSKSGILHLLN